MLRGESYDSRDPELLALAHHARAQLAQFAAIPSTDGAARRRVLEIWIGSNVLVGPGVQLLTVSHPIRAADRIVPTSADGPPTAPYRTHARPITIGDQVWLGAGAIVLPGAA
jgi:maltose O-acetyltransferase